MALGTSYGHGNRVAGAHASASFEEREARRVPDLLKPLIEKEREIARIIYEEGAGEIAKKHIKQLTESWNEASFFERHLRHRFPNIGRINAKKSRHKHRHSNIMRDRSETTLSNIK